MKDGNYTNMRLGIRVERKNARIDTLILFQHRQKSGSEAFFKIHITILSLKPWYNILKSDRSSTDTKLSGLCNEFSYFLHE